MVSDKRMHAAIITNMCSMHESMSSCIRACRHALCNKHSSVTKHVATVAKIIADRFAKQDHLARVFLGSFGL